MAVVLRSALATRIRRHAGQENLGLSANRLFIDPAELNDLIDAAARELYDLMLAARGDEFYATTAALPAGTTVKGQFGHDLPDDFYRLLSVRAASGSYWRELPRYSPAETARLRNAGTVGDAWDVRYRLGGSQPTGTLDAAFKRRLLIVPPPTSALPVEIDYVPTCSTPVLSSDVSYDTVNGWEDWIVASVVADVLDKGGEDNRHWLRKKEEQAARVAQLAADRDVSKPQEIVCEPLGRARLGFGRRFGGGGWA